MKLLVTGGAGFIGSNFVRYLLTTASDVEVVNLDKLTYAGKLLNLAGIFDHPRHRFVRGDIGDPEMVESILQTGIDAVVNLAAETHVDRSILDSAPFLRTNVLGTHCLLDGVRRHRVRRFIHVSSDEVYGSVQEGECRDEDSKLAPSSPYAASKAAGDHLVSAYARTYGVPALILRPSNNYGPRQFPEKFIPLMVANAMQGKPLPVYGDGSQVRDWMHVDDFCAAIQCALQIVEPRDVYNVAANNPISNLALANELLQLLGQPSTLIRHVEDRPGHDQRYAIDSSRFRRETGWEPRVPFQDGLRSAVKWYQSDPVWLEEAKSEEYRRFYEQNYSHRPETCSFAKDE